MKDFHREPKPGVTLRHDHDRLERIYAELLESFKGGDWDDVRASWDHLDQGLRDHLLTEEQHVFPILRAAHPREVAELQHEHAELRRVLGELGVAVDLHMVRDDLASALIERLRAHAAREDSLAYRFADEAAAARAASSTT